MEKLYLPLMLDVSHKNILVLGAGKASEEKLRTLAQLQKKITVISPEFREKFLEYDWIERINRKYRYGDLQGFDIVYSGVNDEMVEREIKKEAVERNILVNFIDKVEYSDFISASSLIRNSFTIFISTYGKAPGAAKKIRERIEERLELDELEDFVSQYITERERKKQRVVN